jgi:hypothetical protein
MVEYTAISGTMNGRTKGAIDNKILTITVKVLVMAVQCECVVTACHPACHSALTGCTFIQENRQIKTVRVYLVEFCNSTKLKITVLWSMTACRTAEQGVAGKAPIRTVFLWFSSVPRGN